MAPLPNSFIERTSISVYATLDFPSQRDHRKLVSSCQVIKRLAGKLYRRAGVLGLAGRAFGVSFFVIVGGHRPPLQKSGTLAHILSLWAGLSSPAKHKPIPGRPQASTRRDVTADFSARRRAKRQRLAGFGDHANFFRTASVTQCGAGSWYP